MQNKQRTLLLTFDQTDTKVYQTTHVVTTCRCDQQLRLVVVVVVAVVVVVVVAVVVVVVVVVSIAVQLQTLSTTEHIKLNDIQMTKTSSHICRASE